MADIEQRARFEAWAESEGLIGVSHGIMSVNSQTETAWRAWQAAIASQAQVPDEPDHALLISMATCLNHGFGLLPANQQERMLTDMRQLWDEVMGRGFYSPERRGFYMSMVPGATTQEVR